MLAISIGRFHKKEISELNRNGVHKKRLSITPYVP
jgi:hypothetical protein